MTKDPVVLLVGTPFFPLYRRVHLVLGDGLETDGSLSCRLLL